MDAEFFVRLLTLSFVLLCSCCLVATVFEVSPALSSLSETVNHYPINRNARDQKASKVEVEMMMMTNTLMISKQELCLDSRTNNELQFVMWTMQVLENWKSVVLLLVIWRYLLWEKKHLIMKSLKQPYRMVVSYPYRQYQQMMQPRRRSRREKIRKGLIVNLSRIKHLPDELLLYCTAEFLNVRENVLGLQRTCKRLHMLARSDRIWWRHCQALLDLPKESAFWGGKSLCVDEMEPRRAYGMLCRRAVGRYGCISWRELFEKLHTVPPRRLDIRGIYTDGGCDGSNAMAMWQNWAGNLFRGSGSSASTYYCSQVGSNRNIHVLGVLSRTRRLLVLNEEPLLLLDNHDPKYETDRFLAAERRRLWRRVALLSCFKGTRLRKTAVSINTWELENFYVDVIRSQASRLVDAKFRKRIQRQVFKRKSTRVSLEMKARYLNSLLRIEEKIRNERNSLARELAELNKHNEYKHLSDMVKPIFDHVYALDATQTELIDPKVIDEHAYYVNDPSSFGQTYACIESVLVSRTGNFTSPIETGAIFSSPALLDGCDFATQAKDIMFHREKICMLRTQRACAALSTATDYQSVLYAVHRGYLPRIVNEKRTGNMHIVEFDRMCGVSREAVDPMIWFRMTKQSSFVYELHTRRLSRYVLVKLIAPIKPRIPSMTTLQNPPPTGNIDCNSVLFYGHILQVSSHC